MSWRLARALDVLRQEINALHPGTTVWTIGDASHRATASDHNPNAAGVVCAVDVLPDGGADLPALAEHLRTKRHKALKYVIWNRRICSSASGWAWRPYTGSNPHTGHMHVSVGVGPDGRSTGPYDDTSPWGLTSNPGGMLVFCKLGDRGEHVQAVQAAINAIGGLVPRLDEDGVYGPATSAGVLAVRRSVGSKVASGDQYDAHAYVQLLMAMARRFGGAGQPGQRGPEGPAGPRGESGPAGQVDYPRLVDELLARLAAAPQG